MINQRTTVRGRSHEGGFTLLEVVVALAILAIMGVLALEAFRVGSRAWDKTERRAELDQRLRVTHDLLAHEFAQIEPVMIKIEGRRITGFRGEIDKAIFYGAPDGSAAEPYSGLLRRLSIGVEPGKGLVLREGWPLVDGQAGLETGTKWRVLDSHVTAIRFRYLAPASKEVAGPHWIKEWDPVERVMNTVKVPGSIVAVSGSSLLPSLVEVSLTVRDGQSFRVHQFMFPIRVGQYLL